MGPLRRIVLVALAAAALAVLWYLRASLHCVLERVGNCAGPTHTVADDVPWLGRILALVVPVVALAIVRRPPWGLLPAALAFGCVARATPTIHHVAILSFDDRLSAPRAWLFGLAVVAVVVEIVAGLCAPAPALPRAWARWRRS